MLITMENSSSYHLNEPLYRFSRGNVSSPRSKVKEHHYLPPYRYDDNESDHNKYLSSDEAYASVAKALLFEVEHSIGVFNPYDIVIRTLAISQIKMFADAHMEKALTLPTFPKKFESTNVTLMRKIDSVFGSVLLEFFATKDGILLGPQVEMLTRYNNAIQQNKKDTIDHGSPAKNKTNTTRSIMHKENDSCSISCGSQQSMSTIDESTGHSVQEEKDNNIHFSLDSVTEAKGNPHQSSFDKMFNMHEHEEGLDDEDSSHVERYSVLNNVISEDDEGSTPTFIETNRNKTMEINYKISMDREIVSTPSIDNAMQSKGFVHIKDMDRGFKIVTVIAHDNLKDGVLFQAKYREQYFTVRVPLGGVKEGQVFSSPMLHPSGQSDLVVHYECWLDGMEIPRGKWRDNLFQCFHDPMLLMSCLCPNAVLSQIRTRMKFQETGEVTIYNKVKSLVSFNLLVIFLNLWTMLALIILGGEVPLFVIIACWVPLGIIDVYLIYKFISLTLRTRREVKARYDINNEDIDGALEAAMVTCCSCCVISHLGRHTADYKTFREEHLSATGLPSNLQVLVPLLPKRKYCMDEEKGEVAQDIHEC